MRTLLSFLSFVGIFSFSQLAQAGFIQPDTIANVSSEFPVGVPSTFDGLAVNTINGSGLPSGFGITDTHASYVSGNHWTTTSAAPATSQFIVWGFNTAQTLDTIYLWNHQSTVPPAASAGYDVTLFDLTVFDATNTQLLFLNDVALSPDMATAQAFSFGGAISGVSSVRFDVEGVQNGSSPFTGLAEVGFNTPTSVIPEPSSVVLFLIGFVAMFVHHQRVLRVVG